MLNTSYIKGYCTPNQKLACFALYLKIVNTFSCNLMYSSSSKVSKELKNGIGILVGQAVFKLWIIKTVINLKSGAYVFDITVMDRV